MQGKCFSRNELSCLSVSPSISLNAYCCVRSFGVDSLVNHLSQRKLLCERFSNAQGTSVESLDLQFLSTIPEYTAGDTLDDEDDISLSLRDLAYRL